MELLRIDNSHRLFGARLNLWVDLIVATATLLTLLRGRVLRQRRN
jgi:hypothetical protein